MRTFPKIDGEYIRAQQAWAKPLRRRKVPIRRVKTVCVLALAAPEIPNAVLRDRINRPRSPKLFRSLASFVNRRFWPRRVHL